MPNWCDNKLVIDIKDSPPLSKIIKYNGDKLHFSFSYLVEVLPTQDCHAFWWVNRDAHAVDIYLDGEQIIINFSTPWYCPDLYYQAMYKAWYKFVWYFFEPWCALLWSHDWIMHIISEEDFHYEEDQDQWIWLSKDAEDMLRQFF